MRGRVLLPLWLAACAHRAPQAGAALPFAFEARPTAGEVRVVPALRLHEPLVPELGSFFGEDLPAGPVAARVARTRELEELTDALGLALPGEVNGELGESWPGQFRSHPLPPLARQHLEDALREQRGPSRRADPAACGAESERAASDDERIDESTAEHHEELVRAAVVERDALPAWAPPRRSLDRALGEAARAVGGDAVLFSWMDRLEARPLTLDDLPGQVVDTPAGAVVVDDDDQPYLVSARVGMALVADDGEVVLRYQDTYETVLSGTRGPDVAGRDLAHALAQEVAKVWATDPRLLDAEPVAPESTAGSSRPERLASPAPVAFRHR